MPAPIQITADAGRALQSHESDLAELVGGLRTRGKDIYRALLATMSAAVMRDDIVHFESALRKALEDSVGNSVELERIASGQWQCSLSEETFVVSIRTEVLGASFSEGFALLSELKGRAITVRSTLLGNKAEWMRQLSKKPDRTEFLDACRRAPGERGNRCGFPQDELGWENDLCPFCDRPESSARLAGQHRCRVVATFRCSRCQSQWSSKQARFNPEEERVLGQKCKTCDKLGELLRWNFSDVPDGGSEGSERERKPHRSDLCEACSRFGNCQGAFFEPLIISSAIALLTKQSGVRWAKSGDVLLANAGTYSVAMLPHIFCSLDARNPPVGGNSWNSKGNGKGNASDCNGQGAVGGGKVGGKSLGKSKNHKGKGKGGNICRHFLSGHCKFGHRCQFLHE